MKNQRVFTLKKLFNHLSDEGVGERGQKDNTGLLRSLRSLAMTGVNKDKDLMPYCLSAQEIRCQEGRLFNKSCHPEFISGSVHSGKWKLPWNKMLKHLTDTGSHDNFQTLNHHTDAGSQGSSLACSLCKVQGDKIVGSLCKVQHDKCGFTLAEVLITLGIIGVVAAITIPNMVTNYQKKATVAKLKEDYAVFNQAIRRARAENGDLDNSAYTDLDKTMATFEHYLKPYLKISKICAPTDSSCWTDAVALNGVKETFMSQYSTGKNKHVSMILLNGQTVYIWASDSSTNMQIWVNVNGLKNKAIMGKDVFGFLYSIEKGTLYLVGKQDRLSSDFAAKEEFLNDSTYGCNKNITGIWAGRYCGALIEADGWKISKDYPW